MVGLLAAICVVIGVVASFALRDFMVSKLDEELVRTADRAAGFTGMPRPDGDSSLKPLDFPGFGPGTLLLTFRDGAADSAGRLRPGSGNREELPGDQQRLLDSVPTDGLPRTVDLGTLGAYRVIGVANHRGDKVVAGLPMATVDANTVQLGLILGGVGLAGLIAIGLVGVSVIRRALRPLERVADTATRVAELPLHEGEVALAERVSEQDSNPATEVGRVGLALNRMLGHVGNALAARHASETRVRQFVADASHELRTPLAAIRGYAELTRRANADVPPEIGYAMGRVESEAVRMTSLVEDLLLLARLDAGRPLEFGPVDLTALVVDTVNDARIAGGDHDWKLELPPEPVTVSGDRDRLHQVLANLLSNARVHTPHGTTVTTSLSVGDGGATELTVVDDGPGVPAGLQPEVFERFARGDGSRSRAAGSTGLGLSIVSAVVTAHGGTVALTSHPGHTRFAVRLPG
ncbi:HAMP domain-containing sensor histidine kinase [Saccharothrix violaceirubra]|uniref:histidine kinase n=1 Tax=Saccharothrix violaceirubra TaxID=413306 RepID=A0A7W7T5W7_9PSEU|nr:HAMP domain-containing sensor histidine kinase [Saccharothrix violaceirubra]MBB4967163.1 two-component system OmpR family sensor kinase [Saccharothrix violaceirubra]